MSLVWYIINLVFRRTISRLACTGLKNIYNFKVTRFILCGIKLAQLFFSKNKSLY